MTSRFAILMEGYRQHDTIFGGIIFIIISLVLLGQIIDIASRSNRTVMFIYWAITTLLYLTGILFAGSLNSLAF